MAVNAVVAAELLYLLNSRFVLAPAFGRGPGNPAVWLAMGACVLLQVAFTHWAVLQAIFGSVSLGAAQWAKVTAAGVLVFLFAETEKWLMRRFVTAPSSTRGPAAAAWAKGK